MACYWYSGEQCDFHGVFFLKLLVGETRPTSHLDADHVRVHAITLVQLDRQFYYASPLTSY